MLYHHQQYSFHGALISVAIFAFAAAIQLLVLRYAKSKPMLKPITLSSLGIIFVVLAAINYAFLSLTIDVKDAQLSWYFGPGFFFRQLAVSDVTSAKAVQIPYWSELGAKCRPGNCVYAVNWGDAVQLGRKTGEPIRLGTNDPTGLIKALGK
jgi:hypothetical protein